MSVNAEPLCGFHPLVREWFLSRYGGPTDVQAKSWPVIGDGRHVLISAPTGSGKTLTAFLHALNRLITGELSPGTVRVLYVSPLKALNNDIRTNLMEPLAELSRVFAAAGEPFPAIEVMTRSGDSAQNERRRMMTKPPEILITTPESLNILLTSRKGRMIFGGVSVFIMDEIHAVVGTKRGTHLITAVERIIPLSGEFQRIALSATVRPLKEVAAFIGGYRMSGSAPDFHYDRRDVTVIEAPKTKEYDVRVSFPENAREKMIDNSWWPALTGSFRDVIRRNDSTLFFCNSRRLTEKVTRFINEGETGDLAYSHHGALAREIRLVVEERLRKGELRALVATGTLELGIDIGRCDQVVLIETPGTVSSALQKVGRSGHGVGRVSRGAIFPLHGRDFISAAVMARAVIEQDIEAVRSVDNPLDILAQVILSMTCAETWDLDELYAFFRSTYPYRDLQRRHFDLVIAMLEGRYSGARLKELSPRVSVDRIDNTVTAREGSRYHLYLSGGTIPDRGYFNLRVKEDMSKIGELDEEFVWERSVGETFTFGTQAWRIERITHNDVEVVPARNRAGIIPFWKAEEINRNFHFAEKTALFLEEADSRLGEASFAGHIMQFYKMEETALAEMLGFLELQKSTTRTSLPHRHHLLVEYVDDPVSHGKERQVIIHTLWGGSVNTPFSMALAQAWEESRGYLLEIFSDNNAIMLILPREFEIDDMFQLVTPENLESLLRKRLAKSGLFGARFRENAGRALLLPRGGFGKRMPLWLSRLKSKQLLDAVSRFEDFPILLETWRSCLRDEFDLDSLKMLLGEIGSGVIRIGTAYTGSASPFASGLVWRQTNKYMYEDDTPSGTGESRLRESLIEEITSAAHLRPRIPGEIIRQLNEKIQRTAPGYSPATARDLVDWVKERLIIPVAQWEDLLAAIKSDHGLDPHDLSAEAAARIVFITLPGASCRSLCAIESLPLVERAFETALENLQIEKVIPNGESVESLIETAQRLRRTVPGADDLEAYGAGDFILQWLSFFGPVSRDYISGCTGLDMSILDHHLGGLLGEGDILIDFLREGSDEEEICTKENCERLLRMLRLSRQVEFEPLDPEQLQEFLYRFQCGYRSGASLNDLTRVMDRLLGYPVAAGAWEEYILPSRLDPYFGNWLDSLMQTSELSWFGCGRERITFLFPEDIELVRDGGEKENGAEAVDELIPDRRGRYDFFDIVRHSGGTTQDTARRLWELAWQGTISNDSFETVRKGIVNGFTVSDVRPEETRPRRGDYNRWKSSRPLPGRWFAREADDSDYDAVENAELEKERVRLLMRRYGILFRELLEREVPVLRWGRLFRTMRIMELSGEILAGIFFRGLPGPQFISHEAFRMLAGGEYSEGMFWINATDPASLCGIRLDSLKGRFPARLPSTFLVFNGTEMVMVLKRGGRETEILCDPEDTELPGYLTVFRRLVERDFNPVKKVIIEKINGESAMSSPYRDVLKAYGFINDGRSLSLWRKY